MDEQICGRCDMPIHRDDPKAFLGYFTAHQHERCIALLRAENAAKDAEIERLGDLLVELEVISDENCTETGGIARGALFQIRSKIHAAAVRQARGKGE